MQGLLRTTRLAIVALWVVLLVALARSHLPSAPAPAQDDPATVAPQAGADDWMGLYMGGRKIGYTHDRTDPTAGGYQLDETSYMRLSVLDEVQTVNAVITATTGHDYALQSFTVALTSGVGRLEVDGRVDGRDLRLRLHTAGDSSEQRVPLDGPIYLPSAARAHLHGDGLRPGHTVTLQVFDPSALANHPLAITVLGRGPVPGSGATQGWRVRETFRGIESTVWLDDDGRTLREEGPMGMTAVREDAASAVGNGWSDTAFDLMAAVAVPVHGELRDPRGRATLNVRLHGPDAVRVPDDDRQRLRHGVLRVERERDLTATYTLPYTGADRQDDLAATPFLQTEHPRIRATAAAAQEGATDPREAAVRLRRWVYAHLEKRPAATIPNALQVLEMAAGDCNEHAVLFAALARSIGLPARVVAGIVYADGTFLDHAWDEVWLGTHWVSVDAAFDQMPADATHIKLLEGGPEAHAALVPIMGRLSIDVLPADPQSNG